VTDPDKMNAALEFLRRTGARQVQVRYSDDEDPVVWFVVAIFDGKNPSKAEGYEVAAGFGPLPAALRLCEKLADGSQCMHCKRPIGFEPELLLTMPANKMICWYQYDPELKTFRRGCE
jgi:hypothetical protein